MPRHITPQAADLSGDPPLPLAPPPSASVILGGSGGVADLVHTLTALLAAAPKPRREIIVQVCEDRTAADALLRFFVTADPDLRPIPSKGVPAPAIFNRGSRMARADMLVFVQAGSAPAPVDMERLCAALDAGASVVVGRLGPGVPGDLGAGDLVPKARLRGPAVLAVTRAAWQRVGAFDETLGDAQIEDWLLRALGAGFAGAAVPIAGAPPREGAPSARVWDHLWTRALALDPALSARWPAARVAHRRALLVEAHRRGTPRLEALGLLLQALAGYPRALVSDPAGCWRALARGLGPTSRGEG